MYHNPVLTRSHEPRRSSGGPWMVVIPLAVVVVAGVIFFAYVKTHPAPPLVNHAVLSAPATASVSSQSS